MRETKRREQMKIAMKNPKTGEVKNIKIGWSWTLFLFSGIFGLPLFLRKLHVLGAIFLVLWLVNLYFMDAVGGVQGFVDSVLITLIVIGMSIYVGIKGNELTAKNLLEKDWVFAEPESSVTQRAKKLWGINI
jgi:uncharacterized membrane protein